MKPIRSVIGALRSLLVVSASAVLIATTGCGDTKEKSPLEGKWKSSELSNRSDERLDLSKESIDYQPRKILDGSGYGWVMYAVKPWTAQASLEEIGQHFKIAVRSSIEGLNQILSNPTLSPEEIASSYYSRSTFLNYDGDPVRAYEDLVQVRKRIEKNPKIARDFLYTIIYTQGVTAMRRGENENCVACRGES